MLVDPEQERKIKEQLIFNQFKDQEVLSQKRAKPGKKVSLQKRLLMKDIESSVTLKDGWRKVLLPALDIKKEKDNMAKYATE